MNEVIVSLHCEIPPRHGLGIKMHRILSPNQPMYRQPLGYMDKQDICNDMPCR